MSLPCSTSFDTVAEDSMTGHRADQGGQSPIGRRFLAASPYGISSFRPATSDDPDRVDWGLVHATVQDALAGLTARVLEQCPNARWMPGRATARAFQLFSYRTFFHLDLEDDDPIVVGVTCAERGPVVRITGDISREESGTIAFDEGCEEIAPNEPGAVIGLADQIARTLAAQHGIVIEALRNHHCRVTPD